MIDHKMPEYQEQAFKVVVGLPKDGPQYLDIMSRVLSAVRKELVDVDRGILYVQGVDMQKEAKELADLHKELDEYRDAYNNLRAART
jgi:hypothetical protein